MTTIADSQPTDSLEAGTTAKVKASSTRKSATITAIPAIKTKKTPSKKANKVQTPRDFVSDQEAQGSDSADQDDNSDEQSCDASDIQLKATAMETSTPHTTPNAKKAKKASKTKQSKESKASKASKSQTECTQDESKQADDEAASAKKTRTRKLNSAAVKLQGVVDRQKLLIKQLREKEKEWKAREKERKAAQTEHKTKARTDRKTNAFILAREAARPTRSVFYHVSRAGVRGKYEWQPKVVENGNVFWCPVLVEKVRLSIEEAQQESEKQAAALAALAELHANTEATAQVEQSEQVEHSEQSKQSEQSEQSEQSVQEQQAKQPANTEHV